MDDRLGAAEVSIKGSSTKQNDLDTRLTAAEGAVDEAADGLADAQEALDLVPSMVSSTLSYHH
jgi:hypothetical protein